MKTTNPDSASRQVPPKWARNYRQLQALREALMADRADHVSEISEPLEAHSMDGADSATDEFDHNLALGILSYEEDTLFEVDAAMQRILDGTYGICEMTGKPIPEARLRVVPWTRYTKESLERIEHQAPHRGPHLGPVSSLRGEAPGGLSEAPEQEDLMSNQAVLRNRSEALCDLSRQPGFKIIQKPTLEP